MRKRTKAREIALKALYRIDISQEPFEEVFRDMVGDISDEEIKDFSQKLIQGVLENKEKIDSVIKKYALHWELERMAVIDRNILRFATYELVVCPDIPPKVTINEAIELAKKFGDQESGRFVNGILDKIVRSECPQKASFLNES